MFSECLAPSLGSGCRVSGVRKTWKGGGGGGGGGGGVVLKTLNPKP